jgi:AcrR family transcriptional regulator
MGELYKRIRQMYNTNVWYKCSMKAKQNLGNREALLMGAKKCLLEKGFNRTTARDIASSAGVSLAAIGYHFSSKEALLTEALLLAFGEWDQELQAALQTAVPSNVTPAKRFEATWAKIMATFETHRALWVANFEIFTQMIAQPATREIVASKLHLARTGLAAMFLNQDESAISEYTARTIGTFHHVLLSGLILQWLIDPSSALSAKDLTESLRATAAGLKTDRKAATRRKTRIEPRNER